MHEVQNEDSLSRQFCSPVFYRDKMIKSSAYSRKFSFAPFGKQKDQIIYFQIRKVFYKTVM